MFVFGETLIEAVVSPVFHKKDPPAIDGDAVRVIKSPAQIVLRWNTQRGVIVIPKTTNPKRLTENISLFDFTLTDQEVSQITNLNRNLRYNDPGEFCKGMGGSCPIYG